MLDAIPAVPRLLILDDDLATAQTLQRIAETSGVTAVCFTDPELFLAAVERGEADIIAVDLIMPQMDGVEVMRQLAQRGCSARLFITSGVGSRVLDAASRSAREHGLDLVGVLAKPFSIKSLRALLRAAISNTTAEAPEPEGRRVSQISHEDLRAALDNGDIKLQLQPKVHCRTGTLAGFEALARWHHPTQGSIPPDRFIPLAENHGMINELTLCMLEQALLWLRQVSAASAIWGAPARALQQAILSLNLSARSLNHEELFHEILQRCHDAEISPDRIAFELTETSAMEDTKLSLDMLTRLRLQGFSLSIDDFGTGYSSMLQLVRLPFSEIKVDKSFVMSALTSDESRVVVRSVIELGRSLGLRTTAEGVEDESTLQFLRETHCDQVQGYLISRPLPPDDVLPWYLQWHQKQEDRRLSSLHRLNVLDTPSDPRFDRYTRLAAQLFRVNTSLISLVDGNRQWFKSRVGLDASETPRSIAFCSHAIENDDLFIVTDAQAHPDFCDNLLVTAAPFIRFYAGCPLVMPDGAKVGTLCLIHDQPRVLTESEKEHLKALSTLVEEEVAALERAPQDSGTDRNRRDFRKQVEAGLHFGARCHLPAALLAVRVVNIANLNRDHGYDIGNQALEQIAAQVRTLEGRAFVVGQRRSSEHAAFLLGRDADEVMSLAAILSEQLRDWLEGEFGRLHKPQLTIVIAAISESAEMSLDALMERALIREIAL